MQLRCLVDVRRRAKAAILPTAMHRQHTPILGRQYQQHQPMMTVRLILNILIARGIEKANADARLLASDVGQRAVSSGRFSHGKKNGDGFDDRAGEES